MKSELKIILDSNASNKAKGNCFEDLIRKLLNSHQYEISGNINFSGMEIDLIANHKHKDEEIYVECKAKEKVSADELSKFAFNVSHKKADGGYFYRTKELEYQAGALLKEMKEDDRYNNLTFFEPNQIIDILKDANLIKDPDSKISDLIISKRILAITYLGDYFIYLINYSNALPTHFSIVNANKNKSKISEEVHQMISSAIGEIKNLSIIDLELENEVPMSTSQTIIETISEVQESENWFDYLPASSEKNHFVGRDKIRTYILRYFTQIHNGESQKRIFYLNGKSGWGKSSLVLEIKARCQNKHYKKRFFALAVDTRSATSNNFVALAFRKLIQNARYEGFIKRNIFSDDISFTSNVDLLSSQSIINTLEDLKIKIST